MLNQEELLELAEDAYNTRRRDNFRAGKILPETITIDEYLKYLNDIQTVFGAFPVSREPTLTAHNRL